MLTIKSHQDFERVFTQGKRFNHPLIRMVICDCMSEGDPARVAFAAAKRLGNAVVRNRSKRVLREAARACDLPVDGKEIILFATPRTRTASPSEMNEALFGLLRRAGVEGRATVPPRRNVGTSGENHG